jgi:hypothetical protein
LKARGPSKFCHRLTLAKVAKSSNQALSQPWGLAQTPSVTLVRHASLHQGPGSKLPIISWLRHKAGFGEAVNMVEGIYLAEEPSLVAGWPKALAP